MRHGNSRSGGYAVVRDSLRVLLEEQSDIRVVGDAANGCEAVCLARQLHPDADNTSRRER